MEYHKLFQEKKIISYLTKTNRNFLILKSDSHLPKNFALFTLFNERPLKTMKNAFYFILKSLFVLKIFKIWS